MRNRKRNYSPKKALQTSQRFSPKKIKVESIPTKTSRIPEPEDWSRGNNMEIHFLRIFFFLNFPSNQLHVLNIHINWHAAKKQKKVSRNQKLYTHRRDWFSLRLFKALNISTTTSTVIETVDGCWSSNILHGYVVSLVAQVSKFIWKNRY